MDNYKGARERAEKLRESMNYSQAEVDNIELLEMIEFLENRLKNQLDKVQSLSRDAERYRFVKNKNIIKQINNEDADDIIDIWMGNKI